MRRRIPGWLTKGSRRRTCTTTIAPDGRVSESLIATGVCFCCKTAVAVDSRGAVYAAWRHIFPGSMRDIAFAKSADGRRFEPLVRISEDKWELNGCPEDGPSIAVDQSGVIHIVWATLISDGELQKALFYATSRDGKTFSPRARIPTSGVTNPGHPHLTLTPQIALPSSGMRRSMASVELR